MGWILLSFSIVGGAMGAAGVLIYYYRQYYNEFAQQRLVQEKQLAIYEEVVCLVGNVKTTFEYSSGDETLRQWKLTLTDTLREILGKSYQWSIFLPESVRDLPANYARKVAHSLSRLENMSPNDLDSVADAIAEIRKIENEAAQELQQKIRIAIGIS